MLQKIKLQGSNLNDNSIVDHLCDLIKLKPFLTHMDVSWCSLSSKHLLRIAEELKANPNVLRCLNLSYNSLNFGENAANFAQSEAFVDIFSEYLEESWMLNHLDLSGLSLEKEHLLTLCPVVALAENIQCFHLNDNSIRNDFELMLEILDIFGISE